METERPPEVEVVTDPKLLAINRLLEARSWEGDLDLTPPPDVLATYREAKDILAQALIDYLQAPEHHDEEPAAWYQEAIRADLPLTAYHDDFLQRQTAAGDN